MASPQQYGVLGFHAAAPGFYFDALELVAAVGNELGDVSALTPLIPALKYAAPEADRHLMQLRTHFQIGINRSVRATDDYRDLLTKEVFLRIEGLATLTDYAEAQRKQGAFYASFGLERFRTVCRGVLFFQRLSSIAPAAETYAAESVPTQLHKLAQESGRQLLIARKNGELHEIHAWLDGALSVVPQLSDERETLLDIPHDDLRIAVESIEEAMPKMLDAMQSI